MTGGIAGGQDTVGDAQIRPSALTVGIRSLGANIASRTEIMRCGTYKGNVGVFIGALGESELNAVFMRSKSRDLLSVENISVKVSQS